MAKINNILPPITNNSGGGTSVHNDLLGLNVGNYIHLTATEKSKLVGIEAGAEVNVNADWNATSGDAEILNKPTIPSITGLVAKSDYTPAHSLLVQQNGTGSPTSVAIGTNEILGRLSGGGSNIEGLSTTQVKTLLDLSGTNTGDNATNTTSNAYADAKVTDAIVDGVTTVAPSQNAVFDALALKQNNILIVSKSIASTIVTGTTSESILETIFIPAGTLQSGLVLYLRNRIIKPTGASGFTIRYRINSSNTLLGSSVLGFATLPNGSWRSQGMERTINFRPSNIVEVIDNTSSHAYENSTTNIANVNITHNYSNDTWIFITAQLINSADTIANSNYILQQI